MEPIEIRVTDGGELVCSATLDDAKARKASDLALMMAGSATADRPSAEQFGPLCSAVLGADGWDALIARVGDGEQAARHLARVWTRIAMESYERRFEDVGRAVLRYKADDYDPTPERVLPSSRPLTDCKPGECVHEYNGRTVNDSAATFLRVLDVLRDPDLSLLERLEVVNALVMVGGRFDIPALSECCWLAFGIDILGDHPTAPSPRVIDWHGDAGRIRTSLRMALGIEWDEVASTTPFMDVCDWVSAIMECGTDTPLKNAVRYRQDMPRDLSPRQREAWLAQARHYAIGGGNDDPYGDKFLESIKGE